MHLNIFMCLFVTQYIMCSQIEMKDTTILESQYLHQILPFTEDFHFVL